MARRCSFPEAWLVHRIVLFSMLQNGNVKVSTLWLRVVLNNILWHLKATLLSFTSSLFIVWAFMSCVLELDPNPGCHTQNHMVHLFLWLRMSGVPCVEIFPPRWNQHIHVQWKKRKTWPLRSLWKRTVLFTFHGGIGQGIDQITRTTLDILFTVESFLSRHFFPPGIFSAGRAPEPWHYQRCLQSISCVDLDLGWYSLDKRKSMLYPHFRNQANTF